MSKDKINSEVQRIYDRDGSVRPTTLVDESKPEEAPLHNHFEWNNDKAGEEYRLIQARKIIRVAVIKTKDDEEPERVVHVPRAVIVKGDKEGYYKPVSVVAQSVGEFQLALDEASRKLASAKQAVTALEKAASVRGDDSIQARLAVAMKSISVASDALNSMH